MRSDGGLSPLKAAKSSAPGVHGQACSLWSFGRGTIDATARQHTQALAQQPSRAIPMHGRAFPVGHAFGDTDHRAVAEFACRN